MRRRAQPWLGTLVEIAIADDLNDADASACFAAAFSEIAKVHRLMSFHDPDSDVSRINRAAAGEDIEVQPQTSDVLRAALNMAEASGGVFDITCAPTLVEWNYLPRPDGGDAPEKPAGSAAIELKNGGVRKSAPLWIDLGGIAKGHAVDMAVAALRRHGIRSACVNAGGDLRVLGETPYPVAIRNPAQPTEVIRDVELRDFALATSGTYFSRKRIDGAERSPLIDATNGHAILRNISASVLAPDCMTADALTKIVMASANATHPLLSRFGATAFII